MLIAACLLQASNATIPAHAASTALRASARAALPASGLPVGQPVLDEKGAIAGRIMSVDQGMVTIRTAHAVIRMPTSAFVLRGGPVLVGISANALDALARTGLSTGR